MTDKYEAQHFATLPPMHQNREVAKRVITAHRFRDVDILGPIVQDGVVFQGVKHGCHTIGLDPGEEGLGNPRTQALLKYIGAVGAEGEGVVAYSRYICMHPCKQQRRTRSKMAKTNKIRFLSPLPIGQPCHKRSSKVKKQYACKNRFRNLHAQSQKWSATVASCRDKNRNRCLMQLKVHTKLEVHCQATDTITRLLGKAMYERYSKLAAIKVWSQLYNSCSQPKE